MKKIAEKLEVFHDKMFSDPVDSIVVALGSALALMLFLKIVFALALWYVS